MIIPSYVLKLWGFLAMEFFSTLEIIVIEIIIAFLILLHLILILEVIVE